MTMDGRSRWIALIVLTDEEFQEGRSIAGRPLPFVTVPNASVFPAAEKHGWASRPWHIAHIAF